MFVIDETGFTKKRTESVGVKRQYTDDWKDRQLPDRRLSLSDHRVGNGLPRPKAVSARGVGSPSGAAP